MLVGRFIGGGIGHLSIHKRLYKGGTTRLRDSTPIVNSFGKPFARACLCSYRRGSPKWSEHCVLVVVERWTPYFAF